MSNKATPKSTPLDPHALSAPQFRKFVEHFPNVVLRHERIERPTLVVVALALAQFGDYATGERVRPTQSALAEFTGCDRKTVRRVLDLLKRTGALE